MALRVKLARLAIGASVAALSVAAVSPSLAQAPATAARPATNAWGVPVTDVVADPAIRMAFGLAGCDRIAFITDAMAGAAAPDGEYTSGHRAVTVQNGVATLLGTQTLAGSTLTMDRAFRRAVEVLGIGMVAASRSASATPARLLGLGSDRGTLETGKRADLVVLDPQLAVQQVMRKGSWV